MRPCVDCGELTEGTRCAEHTERQGGEHSLSAHARGYDAAWRRLSERARERQPFCSDCGATGDLQADHTPTAWARKAAGKPIRLKDIDVVCGPCNRRRGAARGGSRRGAQRPSALRTEAVGGVPGPGGLSTRRGEADFESHTGKLEMSDSVSMQKRVNQR